MGGGLGSDPIVIVSRLKRFIVPVLSKRIKNTGRLTMLLTTLVGTAPIVAATASVGGGFTISIFTGGYELTVIGGSNVTEMSSGMLTKRMIAVSIS